MPSVPGEEETAQTDPGQAFQPRTVLGKLVHGFGRNLEASKLTQGCSWGIGLMIFSQPGRARTPAQGASLGGCPAWVLATLAAHLSFAPHPSPGLGLRREGGGGGAEKGLC